MTNEQINTAVQELRIDLHALGIKTHRDCMIDNAKEAIEKAASESDEQEKGNLLEEAIFWYQRAKEY